MAASLTARTQLSVACACFAAAGCSGIADPTLAVAGLRGLEIDPHRVVFTCHGMLLDLGSPWDLRMRDELVADGVVPVTVTHWTGPTGVWFNWGTRSPGGRIARLADEITRLHVRSDSTRPLVLDAVGFSAGCEALLHAAKHVECARFDQFVFVHSSSFAFSREAGRIVESGRVREILHYWSPLDLVTLLAPIGGGIVGLRGCGDAVENRMTWGVHSPWLLGAARRREIRAELATGVRGGGDAAPGFAAGLADLLEAEFAQR